MHRSNRFIQVAGAVVALALLVPAGAATKVTFKRIATVNGTPAQAVAMARTPNGTLHLVFQTFMGRAFSGLASMSISKSGAPGPQVQALSGWQAGQAGLIAFPTGSLEAVFGAASPPPNSKPAVWGINSANGGATWSSPVDVQGGGDQALADVAPVTAALSFGVPVLALPRAGNLVMQVGLGSTATAYQVTTPADGSMTDADLAVDAATGEVVAGWDSNAGAGGDWLQGVAQKIAAAQHVPGRVRNALIPSGRDKGAGVFAAYTSDGTHVRLLRYGGGSIAVGQVGGLGAKVLGTATGLAGRIWVFWGTDSGDGIAVTRSNKAVTRFEPVQHFDPKIFSIWRMSGDGRLGPLDLFLDMIPDTKGAAPPPGNYYARILPELSASVSVKKIKNKKGQVIAFMLTVKVTDAGDAISGATVSAAGNKKKTNSSGVATLVLPGSGPGKVTVTISDSGYQPLTLKVQL